MKVRLATGSAAALSERVRAQQIATLYTQWRRATTSMLLGAGILIAVMWKTAPAVLFAGWVAAIVVNQAWRYELARRYRRAAPTVVKQTGWGYASALGSGLAGALWGLAATVLFVPGDIGHQALLIVCLFGVILGGVNLTAVYKPTFYAFVLPALMPLIVRVALVGDQVHEFIAAVMVVVLAFILRFGHSLNNLMADSLAIRYENDDLIRALQRQTVAADAARAGAEAANRGKTQFLAAASHDLRQPLHALGLFAAALSARAREPELREIVASINTSVEALERLFSALMDISKLDAGAVAPVRAPVSLAPLFARLERQFAPLAAARQLRFRVMATCAWVDSDPVLLERILANLIGNAIHYTRRGGVVVGVRRYAERWRIDIVDSGIGIAETHHERIFEEFYRADAGQGSGHQGMGLGLAIVRRLARLLEHPLSVASAPGRGSRFSVELPRAATIAKGGPLPHRDRNPACGASLGNALIVVIDDDATVVEGMRACLTQWGAVVLGAATGADALALLGDCGRYPDLIVADYRLAGGELGTTVIARLRDELGLPIPALLVSGDASADAIAAMRGSTLQVLLKPVIPDELRVYVERLLAGEVMATPGVVHGATARAA
ncbi:MAG: hybrid sensor histidine kinase/response regulator [Casimicrobiaceae bacterium]